LGRSDAVSLAERANAAAPDQPAFMDTLAMLLSARGEHAKAIELQSKVVKLKPDAPTFKLNLAKIHLKAGDKASAKKLLNEIAALGDKFAGQAEVQRLVKEL
jgi:FimV-like protein